MGFIGKQALALMCAAGFSQAVASPQSPLPPTESSLSRSSAVVLDWAHRLEAGDPKARAAAEAVLVQGSARSLPLLRRFLIGFLLEALFLHFQEGRIIAFMRDAARSIMTLSDAASRIDNSAAGAPMKSI